MGSDSGPNKSWFSHGLRLEDILRFRTIDCDEWPQPA
jgi:hypothetical protein